MRVDSIRVCRPYSATKITKPSSFKQHNAINTPLCDSSFSRKNLIKGAGIGALLGVAALALLSFVSAGLATPLGYGLYAAAFGTAGGFAGKAMDEMENERTPKEIIA